MIDTSLILSGYNGHDSKKTGQTLGLGRTLSNNMVDLRYPTTTPLVGVESDDVHLIVQTLDAFSGLTGPVHISFESCSVSDLSVDPIVHAAVTVPPARLAAPAQRIWGLRLPGEGMRRYLGLRFTVEGAAAPSAGSVLAYLVLDERQNVSYPSGIRFAS